jgi:phage terminase large subunit-like protein
MAKPKQLDIRSLTEIMKDGLSQQANRPNLYAYKPHAKQFKFHSSLAHTRLYIGGNRSGKTVGGAVEMCYWLRKDHPYRRLPLPEGPVRARAVAVDFNYGVDMIMIPEISRWLPPSSLINGSWEDSYDREHKVLTLANKSFLEFRSYDQDLEKFAGTSRHCTWYDEEPPQHIFNESQARLVDTNGYSWLTMTPVEGMSWVYEDLYLKGTEGDDPDIDVIEIEMTENPHISKEASERYLKTLKPEERKARQRGEFVAVGGRVFPMFNPSDHVISSTLPPKHWEWYMSLDHGFNNPTAVLWHAVSPKNTIVTFAEHYKSEMTVGEHAEVIKAMNAAFGKQPDYDVGDPAINQRQGVTGTSIKQEYADRGIFLADGNNDVTSGVNRMVQYLRVDPTLGHPRWLITANCVNLIGEMKMLHWKKHSSRKAQFSNNKREEIQKKNDHACDSARYFFSFMPDLTPSDPQRVNITEQVQKHTAFLGATVAVPQPRAGSWEELMQISERERIDNPNEKLWQVNTDAQYY